MRELRSAEWESLDVPGKEHLVGWVGEVDGEWRWWGDVAEDVRDFLAEQK